MTTGGVMAAEVVGLELAGSCPDEPAPSARAQSQAQPQAHPLGGEAFAELYRSQFGPLSGYAAALTGDPVAAVDIAQEAFTRLLARWRRVRDARAWLFFVATNLTRDYWRGIIRDRELTERAGQNHTVSAPANDPWLRDLVERLPERQRQAILLHYYADIAIDDIARLLHVPVGTVKRRLHDGRASLAADVRGGPR